MMRVWTVSAHLITAALVFPFLSTMFYFPDGFMPKMPGYIPISVTLTVRVGALTECINTAALVFMQIEECPQSPNKMFDMPECNLSD